MPALSEVILHLMIILDWELTAVIIQQVALTHLLVLIPDMEYQQHLLLEMQIQQSEIGL